MAKNMARIDNNNVVINIEWYADNKNESEILKNIEDRPVVIGDIYNEGEFYHNGELVVNYLQDAINTIDELTNKQEELNTSYQEGINSI